jgi:hypothetical protein
MNTPERNQKNIDKMSKLGKVYTESEENSNKNDSALDKATREYPLPTLRKAAWVICGGFWLFCLVGLFFTVDVRALFPFLFFSLAFVAAVHIPVFFVKKKIADVIIGVIFTLCCLGMAATMLVR